MLLHRGWGRATSQAGICCAGGTGEEWAPLVIPSSKRKGQISLMNPNWPHVSWYDTDHPPSLQPRLSSLLKSAFCSGCQAGGAPVLTHHLINLCCSLGSPLRCTGNVVLLSNSCWAARLCKQDSTSMDYIIFFRRTSHCVIM